MRGVLRLLVLGALVVVGATASCRDATAVRVHFYTDVPWAQGRGLAVYTHSGEGVFTDPVADSSSAWGSPDLGDLVLLPEEDRSGNVRLQMVLGVSRPAAQCSAASPDGCIFVRRRLGFVEHRTLTVPLVAYASCIGVPCDEHSTCSVLGKCVPADIDPNACTGSGCFLPGEGAPQTLLAEGPNGTFVGADGGVVNPEGGVVTPPGGQTGFRTNTHIFAYGDAACFRRTDGQIRCWGRNDDGTLGLGDNVSRGGAAGQMGNALPLVNLGTGRSTKAVSVGGSNYEGGAVCAILDNDLLKCWGENTDHGISGLTITGVLGLGDSTDRGTTPAQMGDGLPYVDLGTGRTVKQISMSGFNGCAILDNDLLKCWGWNRYNQVNAGSSITNPGESAGQMGDALPVVDLGAIVKKVIAGGTFTCALLDTGRLKCFGWNLNGQLGQGDTNDRAPSAALPPIELGSGRTVVDFALGIGHVCAILDDGRVKCWGNNVDGEIGAGASVTRLGAQTGEMGDALPYIDLGSAPGRAVQIASNTGVATTCVLFDSAKVKCFGRGGYLGLGDAVNRGDAAGQMGDALPYLDFGAGRTVLELAPFCVYLDNASVKCWGDNYRGELGLGDTNDRGDGPGEMGDALPAVDVGN